MIFKKVFCVSILFTVLIFGQTNTNNSKGFNLNVKTGVLFPTNNKYLFVNMDATKIPYTLRNILIKHGYSIGIGFELLQLIKVSDSFFNVDLEVNFGNASTGQVEIRSDNISKMNYNQLTSLIWLKIINSGVLNPYFRIPASPKHCFAWEYHRELNTNSLKILC